MRHYRSGVRKSSRIHATRMRLRKSRDNRMSYDLIITRLAALATFDGDRTYVGEELKDVFKKHIDELLKTNEFRSVASQIENELAATMLPNDPEHPEDTEVRFPDEIVSVLPSQKFRCEIAGTDWILRTRPSVTGCALQKDTRRTKLWWTFEGIPADPDPDHRPTTDDIASFVARADQVVEKTMPVLASAYEKALTIFSTGTFKRSGVKIRISVAESDTEAVAALFDALCFEARNVSEVGSSHASRLQEAKTGLEELNDFVKDLTGQPKAVRDDTIQVIDSEPMFPKVSGILCRPQTPPDESTVVGFARRQGARNGYRLLPANQKKIFLSEDNIRMVSAARPLSGMLANQEARRIDPIPA